MVTAYHLISIQFLSHDLEQGQNKFHRWKSIVAWQHWGRKSNPKLSHWRKVQCKALPAVLLTSLNLVLTGPPLMWEHSASTAWPLCWGDPPATWMTMMHIMWTPIFHLPSFACSSFPEFRVIWWQRKQKLSLLWNKILAILPVAWFFPSSSFNLSI